MVYLETIFAVNSKKKGIVMKHSLWNEMRGNKQSVPATILATSQGNIYILTSIMPSDLAPSNFSIPLSLFLHQPRKYCYHLSTSPEP